jgi:alkylation response protein AidB-like acyl-CoA dehydrogenase
MSEQQSTFFTDVRKFVADEIRPFAGSFEAEGAVPKDLIRKLAERKYLAAPFPPEYGGLALDPVDYGLLTFEIGKGCPSTRALLTVHTSLVGETLLKWGTKEQKDRYLIRMAKGEMIAAFGLTEPDVGSDAKGVKTSYRKEGNRYILNGKKKWITYGAVADLFIIIASCEGQVTAFLVEREMPGVRTTPMTGLLASRAARLAEIELVDVPVPEENVIGRTGAGFSYVVNSALDFGRYSIAWAGAAIAEAALEEMVTYSRSRTQFGKKLYSFQLVGGMIANALTKTHAAKALCMDAGRMRKSNEENAVMQTTIAKYFTSKVAIENAIDAVQVHGGNGCCGDYPVERLFREAKILEIIEGTSQIQQEVISIYGLRAYYMTKKTG